MTYCVYMEAISFYYRQKNSFSSACFFIIIGGIIQLLRVPWHKNKQFACHNSNCPLLIVGKLHPHSQHADLFLCRKMSNTISLSYNVPFLAVWVLFVWISFFFPWGLLMFMNLVDFPITSLFIIVFKVLPKSLCER